MVFLVVLLRLHGLAQATQKTGSRVSERAAKSLDPSSSTEAAVDISHCRHIPLKVFNGGSRFPPGATPITVQLNRELSSRASAI